MKNFKLKSIILTTAIIATSSLSAALPTAETNYINDLLGDRATGLGGAYTAVSDDPSGAFYNPAGLAFAFDNQISLSVNSYKVKKITIDKAIGSEKPYVQDLSSFYPSFFGVVSTIGDIKIAITFANINNELLDQDDFYTGVNETIGLANTSGTVLYEQLPAEYTINYNITDNTILGGLSAAAFLMKNLTAGLSVNFLKRRKQEIFHQVVGFPSLSTTLKDHYNTGRPVAQQLSGTEQFFQQQVYHNTIDSYGVTGRYGMQFMPSSSFAIGASVSGGVILSYKVQKQDYTRTNNIGGDYSNLTRSRSETTYDSAKLPIEGRLGVAYFPSKSTLVSADVIAHAGDQNYMVKTESLTLNGALGVEHYVTPTFPVSLGLFTNFANTPELSASKENQYPHVDLYGVSTAMSWQTRNSAVTLSGFYQFGSGKAQVRNEKVLQDIDVSMYQISLTGSAKY